MQTRLCEIGGAVQSASFEVRKKTQRKRLHLLVHQPGEAAHAASRQRLMQELEQSLQPRVLPILDRRQRSHDG